MKMTIIIIMIIMIITTINMSCQRSCGGGVNTGEAKEKRIIKV